MGGKRGWGEVDSEDDRVVTILMIERLIAWNGVSIEAESVER